MRCLWGIALLVALPQSGDAQAGEPASLLSLHHTRWTQDQGIPSEGVFNAARSEDGYMWFGSTAGLVRFDGLRFSLLTGEVVPALRSTVTGDTRPLGLTRDGTLWISRADGALVHYRAGVFRVAFPPDSQRRRIIRMTEAGDGVAWLSGGSRIYTVENGRIGRPTLPAGVPDSNVLGVVADTGTGVWIGSSADGIWHVTKSGSRHLPSPATGLSKGVRPLLQSSDGTLWVWGNRLQMVRGDKWTPVMLSGRGVAAPSAVESSGEVWLATQGFGVLRWKDGRLESFGETDGLTDAVVRDVMVDENGATWTVTDGGVDRLRPAPFATVGRREGLPFDSPLSILGDVDGSVWVLEFGQNRVFRLDDGIVRGAAGAVVWSEPRLPASETYVPRTAPRDGGIWLHAYNSNSILRYGRNTVSRRVMNDIPGSLAIDMHEGRDGTLWVAFTPRGFGRLRAGQFTRVSFPETGVTHRVQLIAEDGDGDIWVSLWNTPVLLELRGDSVLRRWDAARGVRHAIRGIVPERGDTLWVVTAAGTFLRLANGRATEVDIPSLRSALGAGSLTILPSAGYLWFASQAGIGRLMLSAMHAAADGRVAPPEPRWFTSLDGARSPRTTVSNDRAGFVAPDGRVWLSTPAGLAVVDPAKITPNPFPPRVHVEEIDIGGKRLIPVSGEPLEIPPNPARIEIRYTATRLRVPERARVEYQLDGADEGWVRSTNDRVATYTQLRPGKYSFRVRAWNESGVPGVAEGVVAFRVLPTWYQASWFAALVTLLAVGAVTMLIQAALTARARRASERMRAGFEATLAERSRLARELHDTLLQGFTGITLQLQAIHRSIAEAPQSASDALSRVLLLADTTLREARQMIWDIRAPELDSQELPAALETAARSVIVGTPVGLGDPAPVELRFTIKGQHRRLARSVEATVLRVGREAVVNAVKHARPRLVEIALIYDGKIVALDVRDDGDGIAPEQADAPVDGHWGIAGMRERAHRAGGTVQIIGGPGKGTSVRLSLPALGTSGDQRKGQS